MMFITDNKNTVYRNKRFADACKWWDDRVLGRNIKKWHLDESNFKYYNKQYIKIIINEIAKVLSENKYLYMRLNLMRIRFISKKRQKIIF